MQPTDPLAQLRDIHLPESISWWPPAIGWWLVAGLILILVGLAFLYFRRYQQRAYRREAVVQLSTLYSAYQSDADAHQFCSQLNRLLKTVAAHRYPRQGIARLSQQDWLSFLDTTGQTQAFSTGAGQVLTSAPYAKNCQIDNADALYLCCQQWLRRHV